MRHCVIPYEKTGYSFFPVGFGFFVADPEGGAFALGVVFFFALVVVAFFFSTFFAVFFATFTLGFSSFVTSFFVGGVFSAGLVG